jgi:hypothetical protein
MYASISSVAAFVLFSVSACGPRDRDSSVVSTADVGSDSPDAPRDSTKTPGPDVTLVDGAVPPTIADASTDLGAGSADGVVPVHRDSGPGVSPPLSYCPDYALPEDTDPELTSYFGDGGTDPFVCDVGYPGADDCFKCMIERCCLQAATAGWVAAKRLQATDGDATFADWDSYSLARDRERESWRDVTRLAYNGYLGCARSCLNEEPPETENLAHGRAGACIDACTEVFIPDCEDEPVQVRTNEAFSTLISRFYGCILSGPEANATLGSPPDYPYPSYAQDHSRPRDMPYEARYAETSCARVCFGVEP